MDNKKLFLQILLVGLVLPLLVVSVSDRNSSPTKYNVLDYGAVGDSSTDDTDAFMKAWREACKSSDYHPTMVVPSEMTFLIKPVIFEGPCKSSNMTVEIAGKITAPSRPLSWKCRGCKSWIYFKSLNGLTVFGGGTLHGQGDRWWNMKTTKKPAAMLIDDSNNVEIRDIHFKDNPRMHLILKDSDIVHINGVTIDAPEDSPNTDGIHVTASTNVIIENCNIATGDDCISIVDGSSYVKALNISCGPGHGVSIGSLGKDGANDKVEHIEVRGVVFTNTQNGARIKSWQGGHGYARHILFENIISNDVKNPIIIDQFYCDKKHCVVQDSAVQIQDITFRNVTGTSKNQLAVKFACSDTVPCLDITAEDIYILSEDGEENTSSTCSNVNGRSHGHQIPKLPCLEQL